MGPASTPAARVRSRRRVARSSRPYRRPLSRLSGRRAGAVSDPARQILICDASRARVVPRLVGECRADFSQQLDLVTKARQALLGHFIALVRQLYLELAKLVA